MSATAVPLLMAPLTGEARARARKAIVKDFYRAIARAPLSLVADEDLVALNALAELAIRHVEENAS